MGEFNRRDESGWLDVHDALLLSDAIAYFTARIEQDPSNWDAYLRRGEANHALNQRDAATLDYTKAIALHPSEAFLYLRRGRHYSTLRDCKGALHDFEAAIQFVPTSSPEDYNLTAELYSLESGIYADARTALTVILKVLSPRPSVRLILTPRVRRF
jgi:tetratricopeptide (TPR) repeat protein